MSDARRHDQWAHTAALMALTANIHRNPKKRSQPFSPIEFHPLAGRKSQTQGKVGPHVLKNLFVKPKPS